MITAHFLAKLTGPQDPFDYKTPGVYPSIEAGRKVKSTCQLRSQLTLYNNNNKKDKNKKLGNLGSTLKEKLFTYHKEKLKNC